MNESSAVSVTKGKRNKPVNAGVEDVGKPLVVAKRGRKPKPQKSVETPVTESRRGPKRKLDDPESVQIKVNLEMKEDWERRAELSGMGLSKWIRLKCETVVPPSSPRVAYQKRKGRRLFTNLAYVHFKMSLEEKLKYKEIAKDAGMTLSRWIRFKCSFI